VSLSASVVSCVTFSLLSLFSFPLQFSASSTYITSRIPRGLEGTVIPVLSGACVTAGRTSSGTADVTVSGGDVTMTVDAADSGAERSTVFICSAEYGKPLIKV